MNKQEFGTPFSATNGTVTAASIAASQTAGTFTANYVTDISGSSDKAGGTLILKEGSVVLWQENVGSYVPYQHTFSEPLWGGQRGTVTTLTVTGTGTLTANIAGFQLGTP